MRKNSLPENIELNKKMWEKPEVVLLSINKTMNGEGIGTDGMGPDTAS